MENVSRVRKVLQLAVLVKQSSHELLPIVLVKSRHGGLSPAADADDLVRENLYLTIILTLS